MDTILWDEESDNYTKRAIKLHKEKLYESEDRKEYEEILINCINKYTNEPKNILDIGCSFGASIYSLSKEFSDIDFYGIDPGKESINIAKKNITSENVNLEVGFSHSLPYDDDKFDVVILTMVLQWLPRKKLIKTISEIDRVLKNNGIVYLVEFLPNIATTSKSRHDERIYIFKDDYAKFFTVFPWYKELYREVKMHDKDESQQRNISVLKKINISKAYTLKKAAMENKNG